MRVQIHKDADNIKWVRIYNSNNLVHHIYGPFKRKSAAKAFIKGFKEALFGRTL